MTETKKRIEEYTNKLPRMKEKVIAAIALLVVGAAMMTTVSFAWLAISANPEVSGVNTSIASNGNLEIALATGSRYTGATVPGATQLGDSNKENVDRNITWGNLVNLADPAYGLDNLVLRPAQLNTAKLDTSPLYGALYTSDGRLEKLDSSFGYTAWDVSKQMFVYNTDLGVRAISSVTKDFGDEMQIIYDQLSAAEEKNLEAKQKYEAIADNTEQMQSLATMMGLFMTAQMNPSDDELKNPTCQQEDLGNLADMYEAFMDAMEIEAEAIAMAINFQIYVTQSTAQAYTADTVLSLSLAKGDDFTLTNPKDSSKPIKITKLGQFLYDYNIVKTDLANLQNLVTQGNVKWSDSKLNEIVSRLTTVSKCTIGSDNTPIGSIGVSNAMSYLSGTQEARINDGILWNFEERTGGYIAVKGLSISASVKREVMGIPVKVPATVTANVQTSAPRNYNLFKQDLAYAESLFGGFDESQGTVVANDTYGLAIDLWVRSNASGGFLTLEGNVLTKSEEVDDTGVDMDGNAVKLYTLSRTDTSGEESVTLTYTLYKLETKDESNNVVETWYQAETHSTFVLEDGESPIEKKKTVVTVIGYEGANRVWDGEPGAALTVNSTTQGSGSCYVFYPANSEDQARTIELLKSMKVAFVDGDGKLLAIATMNTDMRYEEPGKVIVPLQLDSSSSVYVGDDESGNPIYAITALEKNVATRISAIVYLDGTEVENDDVLAAETIQGQMNIQFGTTADLNHAENEDLKFDEISISAELSKTAFNFDEASASNPMTTKILLTVTGDQPNSITGYFFRELNSTQGSRDELMVFTYNESTGKWECDYTFDSPGKYIFRSVFVDGVERELSNESHPRVEIQGFTIRSLTMSGSNQVMTADSSYTASMSLEFATEDPAKMPQKVEARFRREDGTVAVATFHRDATTQIWHANVKFTFSGTYVLSSIYLDGTEQPITGMEKSITLNLGMYVKVYTESSTNIKYDPTNMTDEQSNLKMQVKIFDNAGQEMKSLRNVRLTYNLQNSTAVELDTALTWDSLGYYVGTFDARNKAYGEYYFTKVTVGDNVITNATTSPVFKFMSIYSPENLNTDGNSSYNFAPDNKALFQAKLDYTASATVVATIKNTESGKEYKVNGVRVATDGATGGVTTTWNFTIPTEGGEQNGIWQLVALNVWDYYDDDGNYIPSSINPETQEYLYDPLVFTPQEDVITKVVSTVKVEFVNSSNKEFGKNESGEVTGTFMQTYQISGLKLEITDWKGDPIPEEHIRTVTLTYDYDGKSQTYGHYESKDLKAQTDVFSLSFAVNSEDKAEFLQTGTQNVTYAGGYTPANLTIATNAMYTFEFEGNDLINNVKAPTFAVWSKAPTVTISSISNNNTEIAVDNTTAQSISDTPTTTGSGCDEVTNWTVNEAHMTAKPTISADGKTANVYFKCYHAGAKYTGSDQQYHYYYGDSKNGVPQVTIKLSNIVNFTNATLEFKDSTYIYSADPLYSTSTFYGTWESSGGGAKYSWTANNQETMRYIGYVSSTKGRVSDNISEAGKKIPAGTITANQLVVTYDADKNGTPETYTFTIDTITINNPY